MRAVVPLVQVAAPPERLPQIDHGDAGGVDNRQRHVIARLRRTVLYMLGTSHYVLRFPFQQGDSALSGYADSDWAGERETRKSTSSGVVLFGGAGVSAPLPFL